MTPEALFIWPAGLPALAIPPLLWVALRLADRSALRRAETLAGARWARLSSGASRRRRRVRRSLFAAGLLLAIVAAVQPLWGRDDAGDEQRGVDLVVCLDASRSMLARDEAPSRLLAAQRAVRALAGRTRGDRLALIAFAGEARLLVPLTHDVRSFEQMVALADTLAVEKGGSDLGSALELALRQLGTQAQPDAGAHEAILLLTDGEDIAGEGLRVAERCRDLGVAVHCVGFGSTRGSKIPVPTGDGGEEFLRDGDGAEVVSALHPESLARLAEVTGGVFLTAAETPEPLVALYDEEVTTMARRVFASRLLASRGHSVSAPADESRPGNRFQWALVPALLLLILDLCLPDRS